MRFGLREMVFALLLAAIPLLAYFWPWQTPVRGIQALNEDTREARQRIKRKQAKLQELEKATTSIENLGKEIDKLSSAIKMFEKKLPAQRQVEVVLKEVWQLAEKHRLNPKSVRTDKIVPAAHYAELPINMEIVGDFDGFYSFLLDLERLPRITQIPSLQIVRRSEKSANGKMRAELVLSIFFESQADDQDSQAQASRS